MVLKTQVSNIQTQLLNEIKKSTDLNNRILNMLLHSIE
jgi:hypothetical protein